MDQIQKSVELAKLGNRSAFADLYDQFAPLIRSICYDEIGNLQDSEDLCQEVFLSAYGKLGQLRDSSRFAGWLVSIARSSCNDWRRRQRFRPRASIDGIDVPVNQADRSTEERQNLLDAIRHIPEKERLALHLFYLNERSAATAREILGLSSSGFYKLLDRAKKRVASILTKRKVLP